jgi:hypothetical protein
VMTTSLLVMAANIDNQTIDVPFICVFSSAHSLNAPLSISLRPVFSQRKCDKMANPWQQPNPSSRVFINIAIHRAWLMMDIGYAFTKATHSDTYDAINPMISSNHVDTASSSSLHRKVLASKPP